MTTPLKPAGNSLTRWFSSLNPLYQHLLVVLVTLLASYLPPQLFESLRPAAPALVQPQQERLDTAVKRAEAVAEILYLD